MWFFIVFLISMEGKINLLNIFYFLKQNIVVVIVVNSQGAY